MGILEQWTMQFACKIKLNRNYTVILVLVYIMDNANAWKIKLNPYNKVQA